VKSIVAGYETQVAADAAAAAQNATSTTDLGAIT
jgi:hypothetical protein